MNSAASVARAQEALRVGHSARIVQRARLRPARDEDAVQMRFAVEDAINTADFADCGRLILVRRLHLPALPPRAGPAVVARALETAWRALATRAVVASHPAARKADAVYFGSRFEARLAWLEAVAADGDATAWYWPVALPELRAPLASGDVQGALSVVVEVLLQEGAKPAAQALRAWSDGTLASFARRVAEPVNRRLVQAFAGFTASEPTATFQAAAVEPPVAECAIPMPWRETVQRMRNQAPLSESSAAWIAALWLAPSAGAASSLAQWQAIARLAALVPGPSEAGGPVPLQQREGARGQANVLPGTPAAQRADVDASTAPQVRTRSDSAAASAVTLRDGPQPRHIESGLRSEPRTPARTERHSQAAPALPWLARAAATDHGGLLCLLNLLQALQFDAWLARQPPPARPLFVHTLLAQTLRDAGAPPDDPQHAWFALSPADADRLAATRFVDGAATTDARHALRHWRWRMRRALRRHAGIDLAILVQRRAWVSATATHLDVVFPLEAVDLRLRRHGLDSDPGWVPWFGRIVAFHYVAGHLLPQCEADVGKRHG